MDALAHAVESYIGTFRTEYSDAKAVEAVQGIKAYLKRAYDNGGDEAAREGDAPGLPQRGHLLHPGLCGLCPQHRPHPGQRV